VKTCRSTADDQVPTALRNRDATFYSAIAYGILNGIAFTAKPKARARAHGANAVAERIRSPHPSAPPAGRLTPLRSIMTHSFTAKPKALARAQGANAVAERIRSPHEPSPTARR
jgi:hypothetical protein